MDSFQFALTTIMILTLFLVFALALIALVMSNPSTQANILKLLGGLANWLVRHLRK